MRLVTKFSFINCLAIMFLAIMVQVLKAIIFHSVIVTNALTTVTLWMNAASGVLGTCG